ncbi:ZIP zinc/iron transport family [Xylariaceae sp. FL1651]|nr:ZIP zinc/iron transport family [Xylariaceae sp. FL1651]
MSITSAALDVVLSLRQDESNGTTGGADAGSSVTVDCDTGNEYDGRLGLRISSIFVIMIGSFLGAVVPIILARRTKMKVNGTAFFVAKYFGSGVIIGTAFLHLLSPAFEALNNPCLPDGPIKNYDFAAAISLISVFVMFTVELLVSRFDIFSHSHDNTEATDASMTKKGSPFSTNPSQHHALDDIETNLGSSTPSKEVSHVSRNAEANKGSFQAPGLPNDISYPPGGQDHFGHYRDHEDDSSHTVFAAQLTAIFILEFGVVFHSIFIGLTLAVAGSEFNVLYVVLVFHQTFEGLGLGSRLAGAKWPKSKEWLPYVLGFLYALSTPVSIAVGLGIRESLQPSSPSATLINGVFDAISAGILIYTGLVELLAHEFLFNTHMQKAGLKTQLFALGCVALGTGLMSVLAVWA